MKKKPLVIAMAIALSGTALSFTLAAEESVKPVVQQDADKKLVTTEFDEVLGSVDLCCTNVVQQYIGSHININASDTILA